MIVSNSEKIDEHPHHNPLSDKLSVYNIAKGLSLGFKYRLFHIKWGDLLKKIEI